jgi:hypothetical protein
MRRSTSESFVPSLDNEQVTILHTCVKAYTLITQVLLQVPNEHICLLGGDVTRRMVLEDVSFNAH